LHVLARSQREIAAALQVTQPAVCKILRRVGDQVVAEQAAARARTTAVMTARHERLFREAMEAFIRSQTDGSRRRQRQTLQPDGSRGPSVVDTATYPRDGDPRFLDQAGRALEREALLLGLEGRGRRGRGGPARLGGTADPEPVDRPTGPTSDDLKGLSLDELQARAEQLVEQFGAARRRAR
jgi:hypothetical protein